MACTNAEEARAKLFLNDLRGFLFPFILNEDPMGPTRAPGERVCGEQRRRPLGRATPRHLCGPPLPPLPAALPTLLTQGTVPGSPRARLVPVHCSGASQPVQGRSASSPITIWSGAGAPAGCPPRPRPTPGAAKPSWVRARKGRRTAALCPPGPPPAPRFPSPGPRPGDGPAGTRRAERGACGVGSPGDRALLAGSGSEPAASAETPVAAAAAARSHPDPARPPPRRGRSYRMGVVWGRGLSITGGRGEKLPLASRASSPPATTAPFP